jgi:hypothetical protein
MASVRSEVLLESPIDAVWALVGDPARIAEWYPSIDEAVVTPGRRTVTIGDATVEEDVLTLDDEQHRFQYAIRSGFPVTHHLGTVDAIAVGDRTLVVYGTDVEPDAFAKGMRRGNDAALAHLATLL